LRVAVVGAGAIGAVVARAACAAGHDVTVAVRTPIPTLALQSPDGSWADVPATIVASPSQVNTQADVVFLSVKATDTSSAAPWLATFVGRDTIVAVVQNGLDHVARVSPFTPAGARVVPALMYLAAERLEAGRVRQISTGRLVVPTEVAPLIATALAPFRVIGEDDMWSAAWQKLLANAVANPLTALTMRRVGVITEADVADLARGLLGEALAVARACGAKLQDDLVEHIISGTAQYGPQTGSSMLYDRLAGRPMEHRYITGEIVRRGRDLGIPVPLNTVVLTLLDAIDRASAEGP